MNPMLLYRRLRHTLYRNPMRSLSPVTLLTTFGAALFWTIWSPLVDSFTHNPPLTGVIVSLLAALSVGYSLLLNPGLSRLDHKELFVYGVALMGICFLLLAAAPNLAALLLVAIFFFLGYVLHRLGLSILTRDASTTSDLSEHEGRTFLFMKLGFLAAPVVTMLLFDGEDFEPILITGAIVLLFGAHMAYTMLPRFRRKEQHATPVRDNLAAFFSSPRRSLVYILAAGYHMYWGYAYTFLPLYILYSGLPASMVGLALLAVMVPPTLLDYGVGRFAPRFGYRNAFIVGFAMITLLMLLAWLVQEPLMVVMLVSMAAIGVAFVEPSSESYFFTISTKQEEARFLTIFLTADRIGLIVGKLLGAAALLFTGLHGILLVYAVAFATFILVARRVS